MHLTLQQALFAIEKLNDGVFAIEEGKMRFVNFKFLKLIGYTETEVLNQPFSQFLAPEEREDVVLRHQHRLAGQTEPETYPLTLLAKDGRRVRGRLNVGILAEAGKQWALGSFTDLSEMHHTLEQVQAKDQEIKTILANLPDVFYRTDPTGVITMISEACQVTIGYAPEEMLGKPMAQFYASPQDRERVVKAIVDGGGRAAHVEAAMKHKSGETLWVSTNAFIRTDAAGKPICIEGIARNISDRHRMEEELRLAKEKAEAAANAKSVFLATMSHELRTPMNGVLGMAHLLQETRLDEEQFQYIQAISNSGDRLINILNDILSISKFESGRLTVTKERVSLQELASQSAMLFAGAAKARGIELHYQVDAHVAPLHWADPMLISQVLTNLIANAIKFTEQGEVKLWLQVQSQDGELQTIQFQVQDTGIGIAPADQDRIFESFTQVDYSDTRRFEGTGLGLNIVKNLCQLMGGQVRVESQRGKGSSFIVTLPLAVATHSGHDPVQPSTNPRKGLEGVASARILVVDDDPISLKVIFRQLEKMGFKPQQAMDGQEALEILARQEFDLVLMDCIMPVLDGYSAVAQFRKLQEGKPRVPVVALTARVLPEDQAKAKVSGFDDLLAKPFEVAQLAKLLLKWLRQPQP